MTREAYHCNCLAFAKKNAISVSEIRPHGFVVVVILVFHLPLVVVLVLFHCC